MWFVSKDVDGLSVKGWNVDADADRAMATSDSEQLDRVSGLQLGLGRGWCTVGGEEGLGLEMNRSAALCLGSAPQRETRKPSGSGDTDKGGGQRGRSSRR